MSSSSKEVRSEGLGWLELEDGLRRAQDLIGGVGVSGVDVSVDWNRDYGAGLRSLRTIKTCKTIQYKVSR